MIAKRIFDLAISLLGLLVLAPLFALIALWIKLDSPGPVLFRQIRIGQFGRPFRIFKFRTMIVGAESCGGQITAGKDPRITRSGAVLRRSKFDELPQLINVALGDMSLVGPRPEVPRYVEIFREEYRTVLSVKPGITDYAALEFRNEEDILRAYPSAEEAYVSVILPRKIALYRKYLDERTFFNDLKILARTIMKVAWPG